VISPGKGLLVTFGERGGEFLLAKRLLNGSRDRSTLDGLLGQLL
jgi:hypothetical protein